MPSPNAHMVKKARLVAPMLQSIAENSGLKTGAMCQRLVSHMPSVDARNLQRNWNRWLRCAANRGPYPDIEALEAVVRAARSEGWLASGGKLPAAAESLEGWLLKGAPKAPEFEMLSATNTVTTFVNTLFTARLVRNDDVEQLAPELLRAFAQSLVTKIRARRDDFAQTSPLARRNTASKSVDDDLALVRRLLDQLLSKRNPA